MNNDIKITVPKDKLFLFTTLLQYGIQIKCPAGKSIAVFLEEIPTFTEEYIVEVVQTIFLDGDPADDLETVFDKEEQTLALSASMPGLAGAILRRNSFHSALRGHTTKVNDLNFDFEECIVTLKLFNSIAQDKGPVLLDGGIFMDSKKILKFFNIRSTLIEKALYIETDNSKITTGEFLEILETDSLVRLTIRGIDDKTE